MYFQNHVVFHRLIMVAFYHCVTIIVFTLLLMLLSPVLSDNDHLTKIGDHVFDVFVLFMIGGYKWRIIYWFYIDGRQ